MVFFTEEEFGRTEALENKKRLVGDGGLSPEERSFLKNIRKKVEISKAQSFSQQAPQFNLDKTPFDNIFQEVKIRNQIGKLGSDALAERLLKKEFGEGNVLVKDGVLFARPSVNSDFSPINRDLSDDVRIPFPFNKLGGDALADKFNDLGDFAEFAPSVGDFATTGLLGLAGTATGGVVGGAAGSGLGEFLNEAGRLGEAKKLDLLTDEESGKALQSAADRGLVGGGLGLLFGAGTGALGAAGKKLGPKAAALIRKNLPEQAGDAFERFVARNAGKRAAGRVLDEQAEREIRDFASKGNVAQFGSKLKNSLSGSFKAHKKKVDQAFNKARLLGADDLKAKQKFVESKNLEDLGLNPRSLSFRSSDISPAVAELEEALSPAAFSKVAKGFQRSLKKKPSNFDGKFLTDIELEDGIEAVSDQLDLLQVTRINGSLSVDELERLRALAKFKDVLTKEALPKSQGPAGKAFLEARAIRREQEELFPVQIKQFIDSRLQGAKQLQPSEVLSKVLRQPPEIQAKIRSAVVSQGDDVALLDDLGARSLVNQRIKSSVDTKEALPEDFVISDDLLEESRAILKGDVGKQTAIQDRGKGLQNRLLNKVDNDDAFNQVVDTRINKPSLQKNVFKAEVGEGGLFESPEGLFSDEASEGLNKLLGKGAIAEKELRKLNTGTTTSKNAFIRFAQSALGGTGEILGDAALATQPIATDALRSVGRFSAPAATQNLLGGALGGTKSPRRLEDVLGSR